MGRIKAARNSAGQRSVDGSSPTIVLKKRLLSLPGRLKFLPANRKFCLQPSSNSPVMSLKMPQLRGWQNGPICAFVIAMRRRHGSAAGSSLVLLPLANPNGRAHDAANPADLCK